MNDLQYPPSNRVVILKNSSCPYCGDSLLPELTDKEHVIGRRFVPKGTLDGCWNLIVQSCRVCNSEKSKLEDDISAITLHNFVRYEPEADPNIIAVSKRKASKSISRRTKKNVADSCESLSVDLTFGTSTSISIGLTSLPNIDSDRAFLLAHYQINGIYFFLTSDGGTSEGGSFPGGFHPLTTAGIKDWGNPVMKAFMDSVKDWDVCWIGTTAKGYFRSVIRHSPCATCWSWALEWNQNYRVVGFGGNRDVCENIVESYPNFEFRTMQSDDSSKTMYRKEIQIDESEDSLFRLNERQNTSPHV